MEYEAVGGGVAAGGGNGDRTGLTPRVAALRDMVFSIRREIDYRRAAAVTRAYRETEGLPALARRATAIRAVLESVPPHIGKQELIVGTLAGEPYLVPLFPEYSSNWILSELETFPTRSIDRYQISEETKRILRDALSWWEGRTIQEIGMTSFESDAVKVIDAGLMIPVSLTSGIGHFIVDYDSVVNRGLRSMVEDAAGKAEDPDNPVISAARESIEAVGAWASKYSVLARELASGDVDPERRKELELIAEHCSRVPLEPARTFHEALQSIYLCQLAIQLESNGHSIGLGRFDQILLPFLSADIKAGRITESLAQELIQCLFVKLTEQDKLMNEEVSTMYAGHSLFQGLHIGGVDASGQDACNPVTMLVLKAQETVRMHQPTITFSYNPGTPSDVMEQLVRTLAVGTGMPSMFNNDTCRNILESWGVPANESWNYSIEGCIKPSIAGKNGENFDVGWVNLTKCLELALHGGIDPRTGEQVGPKTPKVEDIGSFEELKNAYREQVRYVMGIAARVHNQLEKAHAEHCPTTLLSAFVPSCLRNGVPLEAGGAEYNHSGIFVVGIACAADSLAAIRHEVFENHNMSLAELVDVLDRNFNGEEPLRQKLLKNTPKYGNDDPRVDDLAAWCMSTFNEDAAGLPKMDYKDGNIRGGSLTVTLHVGMGTFIGATPDGRLAGEPVSDGGISPMYGRDRKGPTAVLNSVSRLEHSNLDGTLLNLKFHPSALAGETGRHNMEGFIRTFNELGLQHMQLNVVDVETLRAAQNKPELYQHLVVRVAGYSARFIELGRNVQDDIIARTEHVF